MFCLFTIVAVFYRVHIICSFAVAVKLASLPESASRVECPWARYRVAASEVVAAAGGPPPAGRPPPSDGPASSSGATADSASQVRWNMSRPGDEHPRQPCSVLRR